MERLVLCISLIELHFPHSLEINGVDQACQCIGTDCLQHLRDQIIRFIGAPMVDLVHRLHIERLVINLGIIIRLIGLYKWFQHLEIILDPHTIRIHENSTTIQLGKLRLHHLGISVYLLVG